MLYLGIQTRGGGTKSLGFTHYDGHAYPILFCFFTLSTFEGQHLLHNIEDHLRCNSVVFHLARQKWWNVFLHDLAVLQIFGDIQGVTSRL